MFRAGVHYSGACGKHPVTGGHFHEPELTIVGIADDVEKLQAILAGYSEFIGDKIYDAPFDPAYTDEDIDAMKDKQAFANFLFARLAPLYSQMRERLS